jgi:hypothetical protein
MVNVGRRSLSDLCFCFSKKEIDSNTNPEGPSHIGNRQGDAGYEKGNEVFLIALEASNQRTKFQARENEKHPKHGIRDKGKNREAEFPQGQCEDDKENPDHKRGTPGSCTKTVMGCKSACAVAHGNGAEQTRRQVGKAHGQCKSAGRCPRKERAVRENTPAHIRGAYARVSDS